MNDWKLTSCVRVTTLHVSPRQPMVREIVVADEPSHVEACLGAQLCVRVWIDDGVARYVIVVVVCPHFLVVNVSKGADLQVHWVQGWVVNEAIVPAVCGSFVASGQGAEVWGQCVEVYQVWLHKDLDI